MKKKIEILILEDVARDAELIEDGLRAGGIDFSARRVETREDFLQCLREQRPDVILADCNLPQFDARSALKLATELAPQAPVIIVTGTIVDEAAVELLREGAADYILKDRLSRLPSAVRRALAEADAARERKEAERVLGEQLKELRQFQRVTVDRELRLQELEAEIARLKEKKADR
jgi:DNA-binding NtrC family response regulator